MTFSPKAIEAAARALRERDMAGRLTIRWECLPSGKKRKWIDRAQAALHAALAVDGLALVPKEPTAKMIAAAFPTEGEVGVAHTSYVNALAEGAGENTQLILKENFGRCPHPSHGEAA